MGFEYPNSTYTTGMDIGGSLSTVGVVLGVFVVVYLILMVLGLACYILQGLGLYTIAKRRGIRKPWLSWIPLANLWILGSISDQYQYVVKNRVRNRRKLVVGLMIAYYAIAIVMNISSVTAAMGADGIYGAVASAVGAVLIGVLAMVAVLVVCAVVQYLALYDLYVSCDPSKAVVFLVLTILFGITMPFMIFICRNKDLGMPPRKTAPQELPVAEAPLDAEPADVEEEVQQ